MDASTVLEWLRITAAYAAVGYLGLMAATGLWVSQHPDTAIVITLATLGLLWWQYSMQIKDGVRWIRRFIRVVFLWPPVRWYHRLIRKPIRRLTGVIMARWKHAIVVDRLDDTLASLCYDEHVISKADYRRLSDIIGKAIGQQDMVGRRRHPVGIQKQVIDNIAALKGVTTQVVADKLEALKLLRKKKPVSTGSLNYLKRRNAA